MNRFKCMKIRADVIPEEILEQYNLADTGCLFLEIRKDTDGLPQAGLLTNINPATYLTRYGYHPTKLTPGLWKH